jgi:hypothetical protein
LPFRRCSLFWTARISAGDDILLLVRSAMSQLFTGPAHELPRPLSVGEPECQVHMRPWDGMGIPSPIPICQVPLLVFLREVLSVDASQTCHVIGRGTEIGC